MGDPITAGAYADTSNDTNWSSVDDACPAEEGGPIARTGFSYQDEVAVGFLIDMLCDPSLVKIHCESHDDILLLRSGEAGRIAEFVQVKGGEADKLWSVADLCYRKSGAVGSSIFEVSLSRDQHRELSRFRIVTHRPAVTALDVLTFPLDAPGRESNGAKFLELFTGIDGYCPAFQSAKGNDAKYWIENCLWDVRADKSNIERANLLALIKLSAQQKLDLLQEHVELLLGELRVWVKRAGEARWYPSRDDKIITRDAISTWWKERTTEIRRGAALQGGGKLADKLREIGAGEEIIVFTPTENSATCRDRAD
ncbi:uncharacterized protein DUF4297 [Paraburkholderia sp. BL23I1N1]|uniref:dsDNA nuclease domain-containing protein n=1 Tax=Paraburkholderia sp. BL23I1N1 TaxID=1938802 RepID=UPI000E74B8AC|nr:dsDNA nuclease domain-containing protein [Paraburkholderia sp. BL23I1N1]RKE35652.1 uncharacterized protein DUF4297 [Paraburkholderia sp. BL23I1N1]